MLDICIVNIFYNKWYNIINDENWQCLSLDIWTDGKQTYEFQWVIEGRLAGSWHTYDLFAIPVGSYTWY